MSEGRFSFAAFAGMLLVVLALAGGLNYVVDPLWYLQGNRITGRNFAFNERISKINLLNRTADQGWDCLILGSSRVTSLRASGFEGLRCFNLSLKGAEAPEQLAYGRYARERGLRPRVLIVAVDDFNFIDRPTTARRTQPRVEGTPSAWHAFFSTDVLTFSVMTLAGLSPDPNYYDRNFDQQVLYDTPRFKPRGKDKPDLPCSKRRIETFREIRALFPEARALAYAPLMSPWYLFNDVYTRGLLDCTLDAYHAVARDYDTFLDFGIPSPITLDNELTSDGTHFKPQANDAIARGLQGRAPELAVDVKALSLEAYRETVRGRLHAFADEHGLRWKN
ncbi:MAG: hypothetical protein ACREUE_11625 [Panacagrimonas sp.]